MVELGIIGIGNTIAGDNGTGIAVVKNLEKLFHPRDNILFHILTGDIFEIADLINNAERFIFIDALAGENPRDIEQTHTCTKHTFYSYFHQTDIVSVMHTLEALSFASPFPRWEICGIAINPLTEFKIGLSIPVSLAVSRLTEQLISMINNLYSN